MKWKIPLFKIFWDYNDIRLVNNTIKKGMHWASGPKIEEFEERIANYIGAKYALAFNSGTSALHATLLAFKIGRNDEVIVPSFTFIATANAALFVGAKPIFADIESKTYGLDPRSVTEKLSQRTKAIIPVHYAGSPCQIRELKEIAEDKKLILIEDAAEAFGAKISERKVGTYGDAGIFSFCSNKVITTGEGGAVVTDSKKIYERLKLIRSHGRLETSNYFSSSEYMDYVQLGYNFRMSSITAALGIAQMKKIDKIIEMRRKNASYMNKKLSQSERLSLPIAPEDYFHVYQMYTIRIKNGREIRDMLMRYLSARGIMSKVYFYPVHLTHFYKMKFGYKGGELPLTEKISHEVLTLPMHPTLSKKEMDYIAEQIYSFFERGMKVE